MLVALSGCVINTPPATPTVEPYPILQELFAPIQPNPYPYPDNPVTFPEGTIYFISCV